MTDQVETVRPMTDRMESPRSAADQMEAVRQVTDRMERIDDLQRNGCRIIQRQDLFCFGMDAVLLAAWAVAKRGNRVLDLCAGNGIVPILMDARLPEEVRKEGSIHFTGVEINPVSVDLARRSARMNGQSERMEFLAGDIRMIGRKPSLLKSGNIGSEDTDPESGVHENRYVDLAPDSFDVVTVNPPYLTEGGGPGGASDDQIIARQEVLCTIDDVAGAAARALKQTGHLYLVHRPHRLGDIFLALNRHYLGVKSLRMVHPFADKEAKLVLIDAVKGGRMYVHIQKPMIIYREAGVYTEELKALYG